MSSKMISGGEHGFSLCSKPYNPTKRSMFEPCSHLSFNTHFSKPSLSFRSPSASYRTRTRASVNAVYSPEKTTESFYDLLGIPESGNLSEIKKAYKQLARKYHPDVSPPDRTEEYTKRFIRVQEAYETLSDPQSRALYDSDLAKGLHLAFSGRRRGQYDQRSYEGGEWKNVWQSQLMELKRRSMNKHSRGNVMSWGARMRRQRNDIFDLGFN